MRHGLASFSSDASDTQPRATSHIKSPQQSLTTTTSTHQNNQPHAIMTTKKNKKQKRQRRDRPARDRDQGAAGQEDPLCRAAVPPGRQLRRLGGLGAGAGEQVAFLRGTGFGACCRSGSGTWFFSLVVAGRRPVCKTGGCRPHRSPLLVTPLSSCPFRDTRSGHNNTSRQHTAIQNLPWSPVHAPRHPEGSHLCLCARPIPQRAIAWLLKPPPPGSSSSRARRASSSRAGVVRSHVARSPPPPPPPRWLLLLLLIRLLPLLGTRATAARPSRARRLVPRRRSRPRRDTTWARRLSPPRPRRRSPPPLPLPPPSTPPPPPLSRRWRGRPTSPRRWRQEPTPGHTHRDRRRSCAPLLAACTTPTRLGCAAAAPLFFGGGARAAAVAAAAASSAAAGSARARG